MPDNILFSEIQFEYHFLNKVCSFMWSHYEAVHHGFCIGYNMHFMERSLKQYFYNVLEVVYSEKPPEIKMIEQIMFREPEIV